MYELETVLVPKPKKLSSIEGPIEDIFIGPSVVFENTELAVTYSKVMTYHARCAALKQKLVLKLLGEGISEASRILLSLEKDLDKNHVIEKVVKEYADEDFKIAFSSVKSTFREVDDVRNRFAHHLWGEAGLYGGRSVILAPPSVLHSGSIAEIEFSHELSKDPLVCRAGRVREEFTKRFPDPAGIEIWTPDDFAAAERSVLAYICTVNALTDAIPPCASYIQVDMASRQELLDLIKEKKLLSSSPSIFFSMRFQHKLAQQHEEAMRNAK